MKQVIFLRHGRAEDREDFPDEKTRVLTEEGIRNLEEDMPTLAKYLKTKSGIEICSSPLPRAKQTADILGRNFDKISIHEYNFLYENRLDLLQDMLLKSTADIVVVVGHNPYFDYWVSKLVGEKIYFKKGEAIEVEFEDVITWKGRIIADFKPGLYLQAANIKTLYDSFELLNRNILVAYEKVLFDGLSVKSVHDLRVSIRKYISLLNFFKNICKKKQFIILRANLKYLISSLAYLRELDVLIKQYKLSLDDQDIKTKLGVLLEEEREAEQIKLRTVLLSDEYHSSLKSIFTNTMKVFNKEKITYDRIEDYIEDKLVLWKSEFEKEFLELNKNDIKAIHKFRIFCKKLRYASETWNFDAGKLYKTSKKLQEKLGDLCDVDRNIDIMKTIVAKLDSGLSSELDDELGSFIEFELLRKTDIEKTLSDY